MKMERHSRGEPVWTSGETLNLLAEISAVDVDPVISFKKWLTVSQNISSGRPRSVDQCRRKWASLLDAYSKAKELVSFWNPLDDEEFRAEIRVSDDFDLEVCKAMDELLMGNKDDEEEERESADEEEPEAHEGRAILLKQDCLGKMGPNPATPKSKGFKRKRMCKGKHTRKVKLNKALRAPTGEVASAKANPSLLLTKKSSKKKLKFDVNLAIDKVFEEYIPTSEKYSTNPHTPEKKGPRKRDLMAKGCPKTVVVAEKSCQQTLTFNLNLAINEVLEKYIPALDPLTPNANGFKHGDVMAKAGPKLVAGKSCKKTLPSDLKLAFNVLDGYIPALERHSINPPTPNKKDSRKRLMANNPALMDRIENQSAPTITSTSTEGKQVRGSKRRSLLEYLPKILKKKRSKKINRSPISSTVLAADILENNIKDTVWKGIMKKKRSKLPTRARDFASLMERGLYFDICCTPSVSLDTNSEINQSRKGKKREFFPVDYQCENQNALVIYEGDETIVPYVGVSDPVKRRRVRPKIALDEEMGRVPMLPLENTNNVGINGKGDQKEKCDGEPLQERAASFIARMRLVQGNRSFSPWKGSVLDSVVGVFLTQNVSDHVSSSAFISLTARFPLESESSFRPSDPEDSSEEEIELDDSPSPYSAAFSKDVVDSLVAQPGSKSNSNDNSFLSFVDLLELVESSSFSVGSSKDIVDSSVAQSGCKPNSNYKRVFSFVDLLQMVASSPRDCDQGTNLSSEGKIREKTGDTTNWDSLRVQAQVEGKLREKTGNMMDTADWEAVRCADVNEIADAIKIRGMHNKLAGRIKDLLNRLVEEHGSTDLEWLRDVLPDKVKDYLLSIRGLGLKSAECVRLLTLHHPAFPVDANVARVVVRLGWVPLVLMPESLQLHLLELYPVVNSIQKYLWQRLCKLDQRTLYELHCQMITFGKVFCTKIAPNCNACPMREECLHFASASTSARLALPSREEKSIVSGTEYKTPRQNTDPIVEFPSTPEIKEPQQIPDIEDAFWKDPHKLSRIKFNSDKFPRTTHQNMVLEEGDVSKALVPLTVEAASIHTVPLKTVNRLRTEHSVYELPDAHPLLEGWDKREPDDPCFYLLAIWKPGETASSIEPPERKCSAQESDKLCNDTTCFSCNSIREANSRTVRGTILIPCQTAMRGSFPLNGTYFQNNEVFADHESSLKPIDVPRDSIWNLTRRTVYFGSSVPSIFGGLSYQSIQDNFWKGYVCLRGFDRKIRVPRRLVRRLHISVSKATKGKPANKKK